MTHSLRHLAAACVLLLMTLSAQAADGAIYLSMQGQPVLALVGSYLPDFVDRIH